MKKLRLVIFIAIAALAIFVFKDLSLDNRLVTPSPTPTIQAEKQVTLSITSSPENSKTFNYSFTGEKTVFDVLAEVANRENIPLESEQYDFGVFVKSLDNVEGSDYGYWIYLINDDPGMVAADKQIINDKDKIEWEYVLE